MVHVGITSVQFDAGPEGICTGRLIRALLEAGFRITLLTSTKARLGLEHPFLTVHVFSHQPREPRLLLRWLARVRGEFAHNFYVWGRRASLFQFPENDVPDLFYGRAWPTSSLIPAYNLAQRYRRPLISHLSDPVPPPNEKPATQQTLADLQQIVNRSAAVTFTNEETIAYQRHFTNLASGKAELLRHVSPATYKLPPYDDNDAFYYVGAIGNRKVVLSTVLRGFLSFRQKQGAAHLHFVNDHPEVVRGVVRSLGLDSSPIHMHPFVQNVEHVFRSAGTLVSLEPPVDTPVWTLTKTVEYLQTNRKVLALTSRGSPTQRLLERFPESCVVITDYTIEAIAEGFARIAVLEPDEGHFKARLAGMSEYQGGDVAEHFLQICERMLIG